jgi:excinuclease ABC subunit C
MQVVDMFCQNISTESENIFSKLQFVSIAKREEELFLPGEKISILLEKDSEELRLVQKIRDEAHRFAITFNRDSRIKSSKKNMLEDLPGI